MRAREKATTMKQAGEGREKATAVKQAGEGEAMEARWRQMTDD